jgi:hypothetical protein
VQHIVADLRWTGGGAGGPGATPRYNASSEPVHEERWLVTGASDSERWGEKQGTNGGAYQGTGARTGGQDAF